VTPGRKGTLVLLKSPGHNQEEGGWDPVSLEEAAGEIDEIKKISCMHGGFKRTGFGSRKERGGT